MRSAILKQRADKSTISAIGADVSKLNENHSRIQDGMFQFEQSYRNSKTKDSQLANQGEVAPIKESQASEV